MKSAKLKISFEELSEFVDNQGDDNYQHIQKIMNSMGKHPIIPAFQTISKIGNTEISDELRQARSFGIEAVFSSIICPEEKIVFHRNEGNGKIAFLWENPNKYLRSFKFKSFVGVVFCIKNSYESDATHRPYSRRLPVAHDKLQSFSEVIGSRKCTHLTNMFYAASCATSILVQSFKDPRNTFEDKVFLLKNRNESTPFYRSIKLNFNNSAEFVPKDILYEFNGRISLPRTVFIDFRAINQTEELVNGTLKFDFIPKLGVLRFTRDLMDSD
jgi:hypothetical protein